jgi:transposase
MRRAGEQARRYPSDLTEAQWQVIAPHLPAEVPGRRGRPRVWPLRAIVEAILYLDRAGCAWRYLPDSFPPWRTVYGYFAAWRDDGTLARLHDALRAQVRAAAGRQAEPTAAIIDSQSVRAADTVPRATRGWDNAKKVNGRKRHIAVDATGLLLAVVITAASVQDRDAARPLLWNLHRTSRRIRLIWADAVYTGKIAAWAAVLKMNLHIVARRQAHTFEVLPRRWVVERTFAWISKHRRTVRDYERLPASHEAMILWAMTALMASRLAQPSHLPNTHSDLAPSGNLGELVNPGPVKIDGSIYPKSILFYCNVGDPTAFPAYKLEHNARRFQATIGLGARFPPQFEAGVILVGDGHTLRTFTVSALSLNPPANYGSPFPA